jgi:hypothetical protein
MAQGASVTPRIPNRLFGPGVFVGGAFAGVLAGIIMGFSASAYAGAIGAGWPLPMQNVAATYYGPMAYVGAAGVTAIGVFTHLAVSAAFGVIFAALTLKLRSVKSTFWLGIAYGTAVWAFNTYVTLAVINETMWARVAMISVFWFFVHWIYGGFLGLFTPGLRRAFAAKPSQELPEPASGSGRAAA